MESFFLLLALAATPIPSPEGEMEIVRQDIKSIPVKLQCDVRYMTSYAVRPDIVNTKILQIDQYGSAVRIPNKDGVLGPKAEEKQMNMQQVCSLVASFALNSVSLKGHITVPKEVPGSDGRIIRFFLSDYGINPKDWDKFVSTEPYFADVPCSDLIEQTQCFRPLIRTDWFLAFSMYEPGYSLLLYSSLGKAPKNEKELFEVFKFDINVVRQLEKDKGAVVNGYVSTVSYNNRKLQRYPGILGYAHRSHDFLDNVDKIVKLANGKQRILLRNPTENLLENPHPDAVFDSDASEFIFSMANGLQAYALVGKDRNIVDKADPDIVRDTMNFTNDVFVRTAATCIWCHKQGINNPGNYNFSTIGPNKIGDIKGYDPRVIQFLKRFYATDYPKLIFEDQQHYIDAVARCNLLFSADNADYFRNLIVNYKFEAVTAEQAAREIGRTPEELHAIVRGGTSKDLIDLFSSPPLHLLRKNWEASGFNYVRALMKGTIK